ncbi:hypothetical protein JCM8202_000334 [Rhodotorula sphaerocarpa]
MHAPFALSPLISPEALGTAAITASLLYTDRILLGTDNGSLIIFDLSSQSAAGASINHGAPPPTATFVSRHDRFASKAIDQLAVIKELNALVCLAGGDLTLHSLPDLSLLSSFASQTRGGGSTFALHTEIRPPRSAQPPGPQQPAPPSASSRDEPPTIRTTLALACKRRLILLSWVDGTTWNPLVELPLPHRIRGMAFVDQEDSTAETKLVAGFSTGEYGIVTLPTPDIRGPIKGPFLGDLFSLSIPVAESKSTTASRTSLGGLRNLGGALGGALARKLDKNAVVKVPRVPRPRGGSRRRSGGVRDDGPGKGDDQSAVDKWLWQPTAEGGESSARDGEVLVVRDRTVIPLRADGRQRSLDATINLPAPVDEAHVAPPYIVSLTSPSPDLPNDASLAHPDVSQYSLAVHTLSDLSPVQSLPVPPTAPSPPASLAASSLAALSGSPARPPAYTARLLTISSTSPKPPLLVLTSKSNASANAPASLGGGGVEQTLWAVTIQSWPEQIEALGRQEGKWERGLELLRASFDSLSSPLPPPLARRLASLHSLHLFRTNRFASAVDAWIELDLAPAKIVALYPQAISGKLFLETDVQEELFGGRTFEHVKEASRPAAQDGDESSNESAVGEDLVGPSNGPARARRGVFGAPAMTSASDPAPATAKPENDDAASIRTMASRFSSTLGSKKSWIREREASADLEGIAERAEREEQLKAKRDAENHARSVDELIRYLTDRRQKYSHALAALPAASRPVPSAPRPTASPSELFGLPDGPLTELEPDQLARVAQVIDTALFRTYLAARPIMVGPLCRIENWCEVEEVEELLLNAKKYHELLDLYNGKNMHEKAVELLKRMSAEEEDEEEKIAPMVRYLQKLGAEQVEVILAASRWVFEQDKEAGLQIFVADLDEVESLPRHRVAAHLESIGRDICMRYLEHIIHELDERRADFHEKLVDLYLQSVQGAAATERDVPTYRKLLAFLETSESYRADRVLGRLRSDELHEARAILLGRLGRHEGALQIYVYELEDHATAERYCKRVYDADTSGRSDIFHTLLRIYLRPRPQHPVLFAPALSLLSTHAAHIDAVEAFELLPPLVALEDIQTYLTKTLRRSHEKRREAKMVRAVGKGAMDQAQYEVVELEARRVKIAEGRVCPVCHKRLGTSVIAIHNPRGEVTHYQCRENFQSRA